MGDQGGMFLRGILDAEGCTAAKQYHIGGLNCPPIGTLNYAD